MSTRRTFIRECSALAVSAAFLPVAVAAGPRPPWAVSPEAFAFGNFARLVGSTFVVRDFRGVTQTLELIEAERVPGQDRPGANDGVESFSLFFRGDAARPLEQETYTFEHSRIGRFEMFIVPVGRGDETIRHYEAIFHRLASATPMNPLPSHG